jgi:predicted small lipoprotein YifL
MWRLIKVLFVLAILAGLAFVGYAYVGPVFFPQDFAAPTTDVTVPVELDLD